PGGINLGDQIEADAVLAKCNATATGAPTGSTTILNLTLGGNQIPGSSAQPSPNTVLLAGLITLNEQTVNKDGSLTVTALDLTIPPGMPNSGIHITIGTVTCGPNGPLATTSAFPVKGLPIAGGVAALGLGAAYMRRRHNVAQRTSAGA
ncbi:MAG TPA: choice-of-anchor P family protein, partial [Acidimicrobiales bacterium]